MSYTTCHWRLQSGLASCFCTCEWLYLQCFKKDRHLRLHSAIIVARAARPQPHVTTGMCLCSSLGSCNMCVAPLFWLSFFGFFPQQIPLLCFALSVRIHSTCFNLHCFTLSSPFQSISTGFMCFHPFAAVGAHSTFVWSAFCYMALYMFPHPVFHVFLSI